jgi:hypothetical protein
MRDSRATFRLGLVLACSVAILEAVPGRTAGTRPLALPVTYQLFGPVQADGKEENTYGAKYVFIGDALTPSTKWFPFSRGFPPVESAIWKHVWTPNDVNTYAVLVHMDNGPANITRIGEIRSNGSATPMVQTLDFTSVMNELIAAKMDKHLGFEMRDAGVSSSLYESRLEIVFRISE